MVSGRYHARSPARAGPNAIRRTDSMSPKGSPEGEFAPKRVSAEGTPVSIRGPLALSVALVCAAHGVLAQSPTVEAHSIESVRGCELRYRVHRPSAPKAAPVVLIGHGFMRDGTHMQGWAEAFTDAGLTAVTVDFCASSVGDGKHADNGTDLVAVRRALLQDEAIYVGVSAGGLAALIAASNDPAGTRGLLLLDPTNAGGQARRAAGRVHAPVAALVAKSQVCNAWRNIDPALQTLRDVTIVAIDRASHCDFEWPSNQFCRVACLATNSDDEQARAQARIREIAVAFVSAVAEAAPSGMAEWKASIGGMLH
jgi:pimeloyl-ACP methyl ester carboxylesterase